MAQHARFTIDTGVQVYFCDPKSPWQRGTNENTNGLLRQYFPKRTSFSSVTQEHLDAVAAELNGRPRQTLGFVPPSRKLDELLRRPVETAGAFSSGAMKLMNYPGSPLIETLSIRTGSGRDTMPRSRASGPTRGPGERGAGGETRRGIPGLFAKARYHALLGQAERRPPPPPPPRPAPTRADCAGPGRENRSGWDSMSVPTGRGRRGAAGRWR